jgi:cell division septation protein DedD
MDSRLKQRLVGAAVLVALAVIFLPMLVQGPAPDSGVSDVPLSMPDAPRGDYETRDLPLVAPGDTPDGGAVGMQSTTPVPVAATPPTPAATSVTPADTGTSSSQPVPLGSDVGAQAEALPRQAAELDATTPAVAAAGDYAVSFGTYATTAAADAVIASLRASRLPARREPTTSDGKQAWRVRIGPYASRADAETARLRAAHVRDDLDARVIVLDAAPAIASPAIASTQPPSNKKPVSGSAPAAAPSASTTPVSTPSAAASQPATTASGFAVQLAAYSKPAEATALRDKLRAAGFTAFTESVDTDKGTLTRVRVGPMISRTEAEQLQAQIKAKVGLDGVVRPHP